ncbi:MAG: coat protein [Circoviridae sp.]|nr:MAG: coat protein [Circoviridae sp.]
MPNYKRKATSGAKPAQPAKKVRTSSTTMRTSKTSTSKVSAPVAKQLTMTKSSMSQCRYAEIERLSSASAPAVINAFSVVPGTTSSINPGISSIFPWLSGHAKLYEKYRFKKLVFRFKTIAPTTAAGQVLLGWEMDPQDDLPVTSSDMVQLAKYADGPVWQKLSLSIPCDQEWRYVNLTDNVATGQDKRNVHLGRFITAMDNCDAVSSKGYIECEYVVEFKGKASITGAVSPSRTVVQFQNSGPVAGGSDIALANVPGNPFGTPSGGGILLKSGNYLITGQVIGGGTFPGYFSIFSAGVVVGYGAASSAGTSSLPTSWLVSVPAGQSNIISMRLNAALTALGQAMMTVELL